jgi:glucosylceramidase
MFKFAGTIVIALGFLATPGEAQYFRLAVDEITVNRATDGSGNRDEVYFMLASGTRYGQVSIPRIAPTGTEDYYGLMAAGDGGPATFRNIPLWDGQRWFELANGASACFLVLIREQDNASLGGADYLSGLIRSTNLRASLTSAETQCLGPAANNLIGSLAVDGHQMIGAFTVIVSNVNNQIVTTWSPKVQTTLQRQSHSAAQFNAAGDSSDYQVRVNIQQRVTWAQNWYSMKCLDVEYASRQSPAVVQQYTCQQSPNQAWILSPAGVSSAPPFILMAAHSGHCLDIVGASRDDHAGVQQYTCHFGTNQQWNLTGLHPYYSIQSMHSYKCVDVPYATYPLVQQYACHGGWNQKWWLSGYLRFAS